MNKDILYEIQTISSEVQIFQVPIPGSLAYRQHEKWPIDSDLPVKKIHVNFHSYLKFQDWGYMILLYEITHAMCGFLFF